MMDFLYFGSLTKRNYIAMSNCHHILFVSMSKFIFIYKNILYSLSSCVFCIYYVQKQYTLMANFIFTVSIVRGLFH